MAIANGRREWPLLCIVRIAVSMAGIIKGNRLNKVAGVLAAANNVANVQKLPLYQSPGPFILLSLSM